MKFVSMVMPLSLRHLSFAIADQLGASRFERVAVRRAVAATVLETFLHHDLSRKIPVSIHHGMESFVVEGFDHNYGLVANNKCPSPR